MRTENAWLEDEAEALRADAERYRWLFGDKHESILGRTNRVWRMWDGVEDWGKAIDAARAALAKEKAS
jgi:hypothetical protein